MTQYHYLDANQQPVGPHSVKELEKLLRDGVITPQTLVAAEGGKEWVPFSKVRVASREPSPSPAADSHDEFGYNDLLSRINRTFDRSLMGFYQRFPNLMNQEPVAALRRYLTQLNQWGLWGVVVAGGLGFLSMIYLAIKSDETMFFIWGVALLPATFVVQFLLSLMTSANLKLTFGEPVPLASRLIPRTLTLAATLALLAILTYGGWGLIEVFKFSFMAGLAGLVTWITGMSAALYCGWLAARSEEVLGVQIRDQETQTAADYMFSVIRYVGRFFLALLPLLMAVCSATFIVNLLIGLARVMSSTEGSGGDFIAFRFFRMLDGLSPFAFGAVLLPILGHIAYVFLVATSEMGAAFFRLVENSRRIADAATRKDRTDT